MAVEQRLGISVPGMSKIAKETGRNHELAVQLWRTGIAEARIVAAMIDEPQKLTEAQMEDWVKDIPGKTESVSELCAWLPHSVR